METITSQLKLQMPSFMGVRSRKYCAPKPPGSLHILTSLDPGKIDDPALRCNSRNNIHTDRGFVLQINVSRQHQFFILKKILGSTGATGARENTPVGGRIIRFSDDDTPPQRSPTQAVISAFGMVIWVIFWPSTNGNLIREKMVSQLSNRPLKW
jgi:hypothetical protein